ncbi:MAG: bifunctional phosphopantothenoylcysteine decarboxylase/phosphopantothenate--cysteine ligase CoaBC [Chloroflexi bacterium]|nr:bifunctional phosphopantothenoylcysteine decarboxylase/phosphopantothenate--cysteine ligase CoaBC [Chloroflexota bacterium]
MISNPLSRANILLGVTGSIAAYKAADLASKLTQEGALVNAILTEAAIRFISPLTFQSVTGQPAYTDADLWGAQAHVLHVGLAHQADMLLIAPATAHTIAKLARGSADDLLSLTALALGSEENGPPLLIAPAMDAGMFNHAATQGNLRILRERGAIIIGPEEGRLASGLVAMGRMSELLEILGHARYLLARNGPLRGRRVVVTAGGTQEPIDPVRFVSNRSSGRQGFALTQAALDAGAQVTLISGPTHLPPPVGAEYIGLRTAEEMRAAVLAACQSADVLVMAAAVADFRPAQPSDQKIKKTGGAPAIELTPAPDILAAVKDQRAELGRPKVVIGFAAETRDLLANAQIKLQAKGLDMIAANDVSASDAGFTVDTNRVTLLHADGRKEELPLMSKAEVAAEIIERVIPLAKMGGARGVCNH